MLEPTLLSRCWVVGGWTALTGFAISSPTSKKQRNRGRQKSTTVLFHFKTATCQRVFSPSSFFCCSSSFQVLPPKSANATQSQTHQWVHMHLFSPSPPSATWQNADSSEAFFRDITPTPTQVHSRPNVLSNLSSSVEGSIWQIVLKWTIQRGKKRKQPCQQ